MPKNSENDGTRVPEIGDVYATQFADSRWMVTRVLRRENNFLFVATADWIGFEQPTSVTEEHRRIGSRLINRLPTPLVTWIHDKPAPFSFTLIGKMEPTDEEANLERAPAMSFDSSWVGIVERYAYLKNPKPPAAPPRDPNGTMIIRWSEGEEVFRLKSAEGTVTCDDDSFELSLDVNATPVCAKRHEDYQDHQVEPSAQCFFTIDAPFPRKSKLVGTKWSHPGNTEDLDEGSFYYFEHDPLAEHQIEVLAASKNTLRLRWTGRTFSINGDSDELNTMIIIEGDFELDIER